VYVISGAYVPENHTEIGAGVSVPSHFYKIVVNPNGPRIIAFWMPHEEGKKYDVKSYLTSVDEIERVTGLDFLSRVNDDQEDDLEAAIPSSLWE
jgi:endonuclease G